jgi:Uma2 family endonuclease
MNPTATLLTADDLFRLPSNGMRHELVKGELRTMPPAGFEHGAVGLNLAAPLGKHVNAKQLGIVVAAETGFIIERDPDTVRAPDIAFVSKERIEQMGVPKAYFPGAPDLAVEVVSPGDTMNEVDEKVELWLARGTTMVWVVNPKRKTVSVYHAREHPAILTVDDYLEGLDVVAGFRMQVREIFV